MAVTSGERYYAWVNLQPSSISGISPEDNLKEEPNQEPL